MSRPPAVRFMGVTTCLGTERVLDHLDLDLPAGQVTMILGASGAGKTTLLRHINGLIRPDSGVVEVFGQPVDDACLPALRRRTGYAVQAVGLLPHLTASRNIEIAARLARWPGGRIAHRRDRLAALMQLPAALLERYPHELSGGQQRRVGICRAMMLEPELLLLDEPFSGVDPDTRQQIHAAFLDLLATEPATVVMVSHDLQEARALGDRVVVLERGRVAAEGSPLAVLSDRDMLTPGGP